MPNFKKRREVISELEQPVFDLAPFWKKHKRKFIISLLLFVSFYTALYQIKQRVTTTHEAKTLTRQCILEEGSCSVSLPEERQVTLNVAPKALRNGQQANLTVTIKNIDARNILLTMVPLSSSKYQPFTFPLQILSQQSGTSTVHLGEKADLTDQEWLIIAHIYAIDNLEYAIPFQYTVRGNPQPIEGTTSF
jgi:hypothetical protein